jgi:translation initiation factor IF-3
MDTQSVVVEKEYELRGQTIFVVVTTRTLGDDNLRHPRRRPPRKEEKRYVFGRFIREQQVYLIDHNNQNHGLTDTRVALNMAHDVGLELVMVSQGKQGKPSTCKILDFGKYKYDQEKRDKESKRKQRENAVKIKEVKFRPVTDDNDLQTKARQLQEFMDEGNRLKVTITFRGREMAHKDIGLETLKKFASMISARFDGEPMMSGRNMNVMLVKKADE